MQALSSKATRMNRRRLPRFPFHEVFTVSMGGYAVRVDAYNISMGGISGEIRGMGTLREGSEVEVHLHNHAPVLGFVRWSRGREVGLIFTDDIANHPKLHAMIARIESGDQAVPSP